MTQPPHIDSKNRGTYSTDHGTPSHVLCLVRQLLSREITHDLASSDSHQAEVQALDYWTADRPCPDVVPNCNSSSLVWCNPPGKVQEVRRFWGLWNDTIVRTGAQGAFLIYNLDHWRALEKPCIDTCVLLFRRRLKFRGNLHQASFPSALVWTANARSMRFRQEVEKQWGHILHWKKWEGE